MATIKWASSTGGDWTNASAWGGTVPTNMDDVQIEVPNITVTVSIGTQAANSLVTVGSAFDVTGTGTMTVRAFAMFGGAYEQTGGVMTVGGNFTSEKSFTVGGGTLTFGGGATVLDNNSVQTGGVVQLFNGALVSTGAYTISAGSLFLGFAGGTFNNLTLNGGQIRSVAPILQVNGTYVQGGGTLTTLGRGINLAGNFSEAAPATINIATGELALQGNGSLAGTISGGGTLHVESGTTTLLAGAVFSLPTISVSGGQLVVDSNVSLSHTFTVTGGGSVVLQGHTLTLLGTAHLGGVLGGNGLYDLKGGGQINGLDMEGSAVLDIGSAVNVTGNFIMAQSPGARTTLNILPTVGRLSIAGNFTIGDASQNGQINNAGALIKSGGSGTAFINTSVNSTSVINVYIGKLTFDGPVNSFGGVINGSGVFAIGAGQNSFASKLALNVAHVTMESALGGGEQLILKNSLAYGGEWSQLGGTLWLNGSGVVLTETGLTNLDGGLITGNGTIATTGTASVLNISGVDLEGTATLVVTGIVDQTSSVMAGAQLGSAPVIDIGSTAVWKLQANSSLGGPAGAPQFENLTLVNNGVLEKQNGSLNSVIAGTLVNNGVLEVDHSTLTLYGSGTLGGSVKGNGTVDLSGNYMLANTLALSIGRLEIAGGTTQLTANFSDTATGQLTMSAGTLQLGNNTLTVHGIASLEGGTLASAFGGTGEVLATGPLTIGDGLTIAYGTLVAAGATDQIGNITVGDLGLPGGTGPASAATLEVASGATYKLDDNDGIASNGTLAIAGTFTALGGGTSAIGPSVLLSGSLLGNSAHLAFAGPISSPTGATGLLQLGDGGSFAFSQSVSSAETVRFTTGTGSLYLADPAEFGAHIAGFASGDFIEFANLSTALNADNFVLNSSGTVLTISDTSAHSYSLTFTTAQSQGSLLLAFGPHGSAALFHT